MAQRAAQGQGPSFPSGIFEVRGELYWYMLGLWTRLIGLSEFSLRLLSSLWGIAGIIAIYLLGKAVYNKKIGLLASSFYALSPVLVGLSRMARMYSQWIVLLVIMFYFFYKGGWKIWLGILIFLLAYFTHRGTLIFIPGIILTLFIKEETAPGEKIGYVIILALIVVGLSRHLLLNPRLKVESVGVDSSNKAFIRPGLKGSAFYLQVLSGIRNDYIKKELGKIGARGRRLDNSRLVILALFLTGLIGFKKKDLVIYGTFLSGLFIISFFVTWKWERYLAGFYPFLFIGSAGGLEKLRKKFFLTKYGLGSVVTTCLWWLAINPLGNADIFDKRFNWAPDFRAAYRDIEQNFREGDKVAASEVSPALFYLGKIDYFGQEEDQMIFLYKDRDGKIKERYGGREVLDTREKWSKVLEENNRVWFVTDIMKFPYKFSPETVNLIYSNFNLVGSYYLVKVFQYEKGAARVIGPRAMARPEKDEAVPLEAKFYYYSGDIRIKAGDVAGGVESFQISRQINPWYLLPYWRLGEIYTKIGLLDEGLKEYEKAYEYGRGDELAAKFLAEAYIERGEKEAGEEFLKEGKKRERGKR